MTIPDPVYVMKGDMGPIHSLMFQIEPANNCTEYLYAGAQTGIIHIWNLKSNREVGRLQAAEGGSDSCLALHRLTKRATNNFLVTQSKGGAINFWSPHSNGSSWIISGQTFNANYHGFSKCQRTADDDLLVPLEDSKVGLLDVNTMKVEAELKSSSSKGSVMGIKSWDSSKHKVLVIYDIGELCLWDLRSPLKVMSSLELVDKSPMCLDFDPNTRRGVLGSPSDRLETFALSEGEELSRGKVLSLKNEGTSVVAIRPDSKILATAGWDNRLRIYSWKSLKPLAVLDQHRDSIHDLAYSPRYNHACGQEQQQQQQQQILMAAAGKEGNISLWNLYN